LCFEDELPLYWIVPIALEDLPPHAARRRAGAFTRRLLQDRLRGGLGTALVRGLSEDPEPQRSLSRTRIIRGCPLEFAGEACPDTPDPTENLGKRLG
jgi:hypothetical protein